MGGSNSKGAAAAAPGATGRRSRMSSLVGSGRYVVLQTPGGGTVHALGVYPCSTVSEEEAHDLVLSVKPSALYIDVHPELLSVLVEEVRAGKVVSEGWRIPDSTPPFTFYTGSGFFISLYLRNLLADNEVLGLVGAEALGPYKAALRANGEAGAALSAFPIALGYNNGEAMERPAHVAWTLLGNASTGSTAMTTLLGNSLSWFTTSDDVTKNVAEVESLATVPPEGYFTRSSVQALQSDFRAKVNKVLLRATAASHDYESDALAREAAAREKGDETTAVTLAMRGLASQKQSQALAWHLNEVTAASATSGPRTAVAIVNLGQLASLQRNWGEARSVAEVYPPIPVWQDALSYGAWGVLGGSTLYGARAAYRRFPRTTGVVGGLVTLTASGAVYAAMYGDWARYGSFVRASLARPRVTGGLARPNR
jgi:hypothetical protein